MIRASLQEAIEYATKHGGVTYNFYTGMIIERDDAIAMNKVFAASFKNDIAPTTYIHDVLVNCFKAITGNWKESLLIGIWVDNGQYHVDSTMLFRTEEECRTFAEANEQMAYFDFMTGKSIYLEKKTI